MMTLTRGQIIHDVNRRRTPLPAINRNTADSGRCFTGNPAGRRANTNLFNPGTRAGRFELVQ